MKEIINTFTSNDGKVSLPVLTDIEDVWLNQSQMMELFGASRRTIGEHIQNALKEECQDSVGRKFRLTAADGKNYEVEHYNLDVILSVGYRVKSKRGIEFRRWANRILKERISEMIRSSKDKVKELLPYKHEIERREEVAADYRGKHRRTKISFINIQTGKMSTLWNLPCDVKAYLLTLSKIKRGMLFDKWKNKHNFNEFVRYRMSKEGFKL